MNAAMRESSGGAAKPRLSVVVICYNMQREIRRTLHSLSAGYQRGIARDSYEVILVDNGSARPPVAEDFAGLALNLRIVHQPDPQPSPVAALNHGVSLCTGALIGVMIDGARMASPGLLATALQADRLHDRAILFTQSLTLGYGFQWQMVAAGHDTAAEERLLASIGWPDDGYRLFEIATWPSRETDERRWFTPIYESNALFMRAGLWRETGGYDPGFRLPGGGMASADLLLRATQLPDTQFVVLTGEATFHQIHAESASTASVRATDHLKAFGGEHYRLRQQPIQQFRGDFCTFGRNAGFEVSRNAMPPPARQARGAPALPRRYIDLLKQSLLNEHGLALEAALLARRQEQEACGSAKTGRTGDAAPRLDRALRRLERARDVGVTLADAPAAYTMIGRRRIDNIDACIASVLGDGIPGDFMECGVWRGGACILMRGILEAHGITDRIVWVADSFAGLPPPQSEHDGDFDITDAEPAALVVDQAQVSRNFAKFGLLDRQVRFLAGWFKDTLPVAPIERLAILRLDGDLYSSTMDALQALYDKVARGGYVIVDDFGAMPQCARAVLDFRAARGIAEPMQKIDWTGVFWRRE